MDATAKIAPAKQHAIGRKFPGESHHNGYEELGRGKSSK